MEQFKKSDLKWLTKNFSQISLIQEVYIIGSFTYKEFRYINDLDIVQLLSYSKKIEVLSFIEELKLYKVLLKLNLKKTYISHHLINMKYLISISS